MENKNTYEVIIVGGSYAGLSAALALGRSLRKVLIIDSGQPCNAQTPHSHNFLTQDGKSPSEIATLARSQVMAYDTIQWYDGWATQGVKKRNGFEIATASGDTFFAQKLIFATGIKDLMPEIDGFKACWGISVIHCPYCHGYEFRREKTALFANGEKAFHLAAMVYNLTDDLTVLTNGKADFSAEQLAKLEQKGIPVVEQEVIALQHLNGQLEEIVFKNGDRLKAKAMYAALPFELSTALPVELGCETSENGYLQVDMFQKTNVPGIYACGDSTIRMRSVATAVASGNLAGAMVNMELVQENF